MSIPNTVQRESTGQASNVGGVTHAVRMDSNIKTRVLDMVRWWDTSMSVIREYFPDAASRGNGSRTAYKALMIISAKPRVSLQGIRETGCIDGRTSKRSVELLLSLGYVYSVNNPRLIIPFQKYKVDKGYKVTPRGEGVLKRLLEWGE